MEFNIIEQKIKKYNLFIYIKFFMKIKVITT